MKRFVIFSICLTGLILVFSPSGIAQKNQLKPNIIFVIIDDLGSAWIPPYAKDLKAGDVEEVIIDEYKKKQKGNAAFSIEKHLEAARTCMPFVDKLSAGGVKFNKCFNTAALCSPSRASMLTGKYSASWGAYTLPEVVSFGIPAGILALPSMIFSSSLHSSRWSYSYYDETQKRNMDNTDCPVYVWGLDDNYFSLHLTEVQPGTYEKLPNGMAPQNLMFNYVSDPLNKTVLKAENNNQKQLQTKTREWLQKQKDQIRDRKKEHQELIGQIK